MDHTVRSAFQLNGKLEELQRAADDLWAKTGEGRRELQQRLESHLGQREEWAAAHKAKLEQLNGR